MTKHYVAEPDPSFSTSDADHPSWRLRGWEDGEESWTIGQGMTQAEARACERALSELPGTTPIDEVARRRLERTSASVLETTYVKLTGADQEVYELPITMVGTQVTSSQVSTAPFVPYSVRDLAEIEHVAKMLLARQLAPSAMMTESMAGAVITTTEMLRRMDPKLVPDSCLHLRVTRGKDVPTKGVVMSTRNGSPMAHKSWRTQLCLDCGAFHTHGHDVWPDPSTSLAGHDWRPASEYEDATAPREDD